MTIKPPQNAQEAIEAVRASGAHHVKVGVFDVDGVFRGKYLERSKFESAMEKGFGFCDVVIGWDSNDQLYDNTTLTGWHTAYPDAGARLLPDTMRLIPYEDNCPLFIGEFTGHAAHACPRGLLGRVLARADAMGYAVKSAAEFEFFVFEETPNSVREKNYQNMKPLSPGFFGYSLLRAGVHSDIYHEMLNFFREFDVEIEGLHTETGPGVLEAAIKVDDAMRSADKAALFKTFTKILFQRRGLMATFMAKWSQDWPGQSGHLHLSLNDKTSGRSIFYEASQPHGMSQEMRWFLGGQQALLPELLSMIACTVNSYTRLIPGFWAPTSATWGVENRTCALRVIPGSEKSQRVEVRVAAADINPYIAFAASIGAGLWGIEHKIEPDAPIVGNAYAAKIPAKRNFPRTLTEAAERLQRSKAARELFSDLFVDHYAATRLWEEREERKAITDWQLARYFEII